MALEITNTWAGVKSGNPTLIRSVGSTVTGITSLTKTQLTTGTVVDTVANTSVTVNSNTGGRAYVGLSVTLTANKFYVVMARFTNVVLGGAADTNRMSVKFQTATNLVAGARSIAVTGDGLWAIVVSYSVTASYSLRIGTGADSATTGNSAVISDYAFYEIPEFVATGGVIPPPPGDYTALARYGAAFAKLWANTYTTTTAVSENAATVNNPAAKTKYCVGCYVSDSFGNDSGDWPDYLAKTYGYLLFGGAWTGQNMAYFDARAADVFARTGLGFVGDALPDFAICQSSLNSANGGNSSATMLSNMTALITKAKAAGLKPFVPNMTPYGPTMSGAEETELLAYNAALPALCASLGAVHIDVYTLVSDPSNRAVLLPAYTTDQIHLSTAGVTVYADAINTAIVAARTVTDGGLISRSLITRSLVTRNLVSR
jgi:lysophospholipase L1-like esterase